MEQGGIPIGAAVVDDRGRLLGEGHNQRVQRQSQILHAEIDCLANIGRGAPYSTSTLYSTLMPCHMCAGAIIQFGIKRVIVGESRNFEGARECMAKHGVEVIDLDLVECRELLLAFIANHPTVWFEDIGK